MKEGPPVEFAQAIAVSESDGRVIGRDELIEKINAQIRASETVAFAATITTALPSDATLLLAEIESELATAERFSRPRKSLGRAKFIGKNTPLERLFLRILELVLRDQRNANIALITALRKSLRLNLQLAAQYEQMKGDRHEQSA